MQDGLQDLGTIGYALAAALYGVLAVLFATLWRGRLEGGRGRIALALTAAWAACAAFVLGGSPWAQLGYVALELARPLAWMLLLIELLKPLLQAQRPGSLVRPLLLGAAALLLGAELAPQAFTAVLPGDWLLDVRIFGHLGFAVGGLVLVEQLFRNTRPELRWGTKFLYVGVGVVFAYDFFLYADSLLFRRLDPQIWAARGFVDAMAAPLFAVVALRKPDWSRALFVSHRMALHTAAILGAGIYLLVMSAAAYYIRLYGGSWGSAMQLVFFAGSLILLLVLMFSGQLRAYAKVFLSKHFFHYKYDYREEWLKFTGTLSSADPEAPLRSRVIRAIGELVDSPGGILWNRDEHGSFALSASWGLREPEGKLEPAASPLVRFLEARQWVIELDEVRAEPELYGGLVLPGWLAGLPRAWLVVPLMLHERLQGFVLLARPGAPRAINWEDRDLLKTAGRQAAGHIALFEATEALVDARQFDAFNRLSAFVVHDLKNVAAQLSLVVKNAERHRHNPAFVDDAIGTVAHATAKMSRLLTQLANKGAPGSEARSFALAEALTEVVELSRARAPLPTLRGDAAGLALHASRDRFVAVLCHLVRNAQEATPAEGGVELAVRCEAGQALVAVRDTGCGMDESFVRDSLFKPFRTTKGNAGMGVGVYEAREFVHALGGGIEVASRLGEGSTFTLRLPLARAAGAESDMREIKSCER